MAGIRPHIHHSMIKSIWAVILLPMLLFGCVMDDDDVERVPSPVDSVKTLPYTPYMCQDSARIGLVFPISVTYDGMNIGTGGGYTRITVVEGSVILIPTTDNIPAVSTSLVEPDTLRSWNDLPEGVASCQKMLLGDTLWIGADNGDYVEMSLKCVVRTKDDKLFMGYSESRETVHRRWTVSNAARRGRIHTCPIHITLTAVSFDAGVDDYDIQ